MGTLYGRWGIATIGLAAAALAVTCSDGDELPGAAGQPTASGGSGGTLFSGSGTGGDDFDECAGLEEQAELVPVNMFIQFDKSGSMDEDNKWINATQALSAFFVDPGAAGMRVALRFFPTDDCGCDIDSCAQMLVPLDQLTADAAPMDAQEQALLDAINSNSPGGNTPLYAALGGAVQAAEDQLAANPSEKAVVILVTDGEPNGCNENFDDIAALAAGGLANGVPTYSIGLVGSNEALMNQIAQEGGTMQAYLIGNGNTSQDLLAALKAIQGNTVSCTFVVPATAADGTPIDPKQVNLVYTSGGSTEKVPQVASAADCGNDPGWYYDDPSNPSTITLCPAFCALVQSDENAEINLEFGCATETPE